MKKLTVFFIFGALLGTIIVFSFLDKKTNVNLSQKEISSEKILENSMKKVIDSTVSIRDMDAKVLGSGFVLDTNIITAAHVLYDKNKSYIVKMSDGATFESQVFSFDEIKDIAFLSLPPTVNPSEPIIRADRLPLTSVIVSKSDNLELGQSIFIIGYNAGFEFSVLNGIISGKNRSFEINSLNQNLKLKNLLQLDMNGSLGLSGAAVFNLNGELIGMVNAVDEKTGTVFALEVADF